jgi:hypothetical protein
LTEPEVVDQIADLAWLAREKNVDWLTHLKDRSALMALVSGPGSSEARARVLKDLFDRMIVEAHRNFSEGLGDAERQRRVIAAAAIMGLVKATPAQVAEGTSLIDGQRSPLREARLLIAGAWLNPPIDSGRRVRPKQPGLLSSFREQLVERVESEIAQQEQRRPVVPSTYRTDLVNLLQAQIEAAGDESYWFGQTQTPELRSLYVDLRLQESGSTVQISIQEALTQHRHLLVVAEPGFGKSTLARETVAQLAMQILDDKASGTTSITVPLYIPARLLLKPIEFESLLIRGLRTLLARYLDYPLDDAVLSDVRSRLIFVDGLDEVVDVTARRELVVRLRGHLSSGRDRFVLLGRTNDSLLDADEFGVFGISPLNVAEVKALAEKWFRILGAISPRDEALRFWLSTEVFDIPGVYDTPLFVVFALSIYKDRASRGLPPTAFELYEALVPFLLYGRQAQVQMRRRIREVFEVEGASGECFADWLFDSRLRLCSEVAFMQLEGSEESLADLAAEWTRAYAPALPQVYGWERQLVSVLIDTGLVIRQGAELVFAHRSLAEYLAARIAGLPTHPDIGLLPFTGAPGQERNYMIFRYLAWAKDHDPTRMILELLEIEKLDTYYDTVGRLVQFGLPLSPPAVERYRWFFSYFVYRPMIDDRIQDKLILLRTSELVSEVDIVRLWCDLSRRYPDLVHCFDVLIPEEFPPHLLEAALDAVEYNGYGELAARRRRRLGNQ